MLLKNLELSNFKSFAKKSVLEFNSPISAIVGPNGSGKSNVAEAFRFVLGEQSIKSLRGKRGEDLIWNGGGETGRANRASVKVMFDNSSKFFNIDFHEVIIERVVHRDGINEYFINGSQVRLKDILELLAAAHIGSSGHQIISQGEADKILNANLIGRRAMIEDALGLKIYQYKRQESERKLIKTEENIKSIESLRREIMPHIQFLKKQVEKIERAIQMKRELKELYSEYLKREDIYIKFSREKIEKEKKPIEEGLKLLEKELQSARNLLQKSETADKKSAEIILFGKKIQFARDQKDLLTRELGRLEGAIASEERLLKKQEHIKKSAGDKQVSFREVETLFAAVSVKITDAEKEKEISAVKAFLSSIKNILSHFISKNKGLDDNSFIADIQNELKRLKKENEETESKIHKVRNEEQVLNLNYDALKSAIEKEKDTNREAEKKVFFVMSEQNELNLKFNSIRVSEDKLRLEEEDFKRELSEAGVLVGRAVLEFQSFIPKNESGKEHQAHEIYAEPRSIQEARRRNIEKIKIRLEDSGASSGDEIMNEYNQVSERDAFLANELNDLHNSAGSLKKLILELEERLATEFKNGLEKINREFQKFFSLMFGGGSARLAVFREKRRKRTDEDIGLLERDEELSEEEEEGAEGVEIEVNLPRKKIKGLMMLSGGERALTSIALLFAMSQVNPPPFIILDETDAALDEANSKKYGNMIESLSKYSQLILITHNRETMSRAGVLYGVTMIAGISKLLSINFEEAVDIAK